MLKVEKEIKIVFFLNKALPNISRFPSSKTSIQPYLRFLIIGFFSYFSFHRKSVSPILFDFLFNKSNIIFILIGSDHSSVLFKMKIQVRDTLPGTFFASFQLIKAKEKS